MSVMWGGCLYNYRVSVFAILTVCVCVCVLLVFCSLSSLLYCWLPSHAIFLWGNQSRWQSLLGISLYQQKTDKSRGKTQNMQSVLHTIPLCLIRCLFDSCYVIWQEGKVKREKPGTCSALGVNPISLFYPFPFPYPFVLPLALVPRNRVVSARGENIPLWNETPLGYGYVIVHRR